MAISEDQPIYARDQTMNIRAAFTLTRTASGELRYHLQLDGSVLTGTILPAYRSQWDRLLKDQDQATDNRMWSKAEIERLIRHTDQRTCDEIQIRCR
ncbi:MAG: hypothetical protein ACYC4U_02400 [Pirellulaceae bacterium]